MIALLAFIIIVLLVGYAMIKLAEVMVKSEPEHLETAFKVVDYISLPFLVVVGILTLILWVSMFTAGIFVLFGG